MTVRADYIPDSKEGSHSTSGCWLEWRGHKKRDGGTRCERDCWYNATVCSRSISRSSR